MTYLGIGIVILFFCIVFLIRDYSAAPVRLNVETPPRKPHNMIEDDLPEIIRTPMCQDLSHFFSNYREGFRCRCLKMELKRENDNCLYVREIGGSFIPLKKGEIV